ncbi:hypothetical protein HPB47_010860, partial [Ixodes persulcatus]
RRFDTTDDSTSQESTPAKLVLSNCDSMDASQAEGDDEAFILVEHRRKRTTGIPVLFTPAQEGRRLQQLNPLKLIDEVWAAAGAPFVRHRFTARGGLLIDVAEPATVNRLLKVRCLGEILVLATIPKADVEKHMPPRTAMANHLSNARTAAETIQPIMLTAKLDFKL